MTKKLFSYVDGFARAYPIIIITQAVLNGLLNNDSHSIYLSAILLGTDIFNHIIKNFLFKPLMKDKMFPVLGMGKRPQSKNCGLFKNGTYSSSYGMPSGHAQIAWVFSTYWIQKILNNSTISSIHKGLLVLLLVLLALLIGYSRIYWAKCHTIQQVIVGSIIGIGFGVLSYKQLEKI